MPEPGESPRRDRRSWFGVLLSSWVAFFFGPLSSAGCQTESRSPAKACAASETTSGEYCSVWASYDGRCGRCEGCAAKNRAECARRENAISAAHRAAFVACNDQLPCGELVSHIGCVAERMARAGPTPIQHQARDAYCAACGATHAAECAEFFAVRPPFGPHGPGYDVLLAGDAAVTRAIPLCATKCNPLDFGICVALVLCADSGGDHCSDGGFCAPSKDDG